MQIHGLFQDFRQGNSSISIYMHQAKLFFDELAAIGRAMSVEDFNLYMFYSLRGKFKDLVMSLISKTELLSYADLHSHLLTHEFLQKNSFHSIDTNPSLLSPSLLPQPPLLPTPQPSARLVMSYHNLNFNHNIGCSHSN